MPSTSRILLGGSSSSFLRVLHADRVAVVVAGKHQYTAVGVGEAADPAQVLVAPGLFPLDGLVLLHGV